jgi:hypothetical protein
VRDRTLEAERQTADAEARRSHHDTKERLPRLTSESTVKACNAPFLDDKKGRVIGVRERNIRAIRVPQQAST